MGAVHFHHHGTVSAINLKDTWKRDYGTNECAFEVENTGEHGIFEFVVKYKKWYYGRRGATDRWWWDWEVLEKINMEPGEKRSGTFTGVPDHIPSPLDWPRFDPKESLTEFKISVKWILTIYESKYDVKIDFILS